MSDYIILPEHQLKHLTSEGRRQLFRWIHDEGVHYSQFHTADGSIHLEVDGYGFKRFDCSETFADVQRFIKILKHATANQLSWCDAEKTFQVNRHGKQESIRKELEEVMKTFTVDHIIKLRDDALQQVQNLIRERDELSAELERAEAKTAAEYEAHKITQCERDALKAEVDRLKADNDELNNTLANLK